MKNFYFTTTFMSFLSFSTKNERVPLKNNLSASFLLFIPMLMMGNSSWAQAPTISSFTPASGAPGTVVTLTGTNFNATASTNIVKFGATKATVSAASTTSLTVIVPVGATYERISVLNTATALMGASLKPFIPTFSPNKGDITIGDFMNSVELDFGVQAYGVAIGDLDGDGKPDLAVPNRGQGNILIFRNISNSGSISATSFSSRVEIISSTQSPRSIAISDLDGDGKPDLVVTNDNGFSISVFRNISVPNSITVSSFAAPVSFYGGQNPVSVAIGDLDRDGKPDLVVPCDGAVYVFRNTSTSGSINDNSFAPSVYFDAGLSPISVSIGDIDGDGKLDLAVANRGSDTVSVLRNTSTSGSITRPSSFAAKVDFAVGLSPYSISMGDFDGDGKPDLAVANQLNSTVSVLRNTSSSSSISLQAKVDFAVGSSPVSLAIGDLDGDGKLDLAVANNGSKSISVLRNNCSNAIINENSFAAKVDFATAERPEQVAIGDLDGDGKPDMVAGIANQINLFRNNPTILPPSITSFSPTSGLVGTSVTIIGTNYNPIAANNIVKFGATQATVTAATSNSLTVIVPAGATYQPITVLNTSSQLMCTASKPFITTFTPIKNDLTNRDIMEKVDFATGVNPISVAIADLNGDGKSDLAVVNKGGTSVSIYRNISVGGTITTSSFAAKVDYTTGASPNSVSVGDLNGDGKADLAIANSGGTSVSVFLNSSVSGSISFAAKVDFTVGSAPNALSIGDLDGDGKADLAVANYNSSTVSVLRNTSTSNSISFATKVDFSTASSKPYAVAIGDLDGDGKADLAVANNNSSTFSIFRNTSTSGVISFNAKVDFAAALSPTSVAIGDLDGDGDADIVVTNSGAQSVSVFRNTSTSGLISVSAKVDFTTGFGPQYVAIGDLDGDGKVDLVTSNAGGPSVSVLRNKYVSGSIDISSFASRVDFTTGTSPLSVAVGDLDNDGKPDLVVTNIGAASVSVLKNNPTYSLTYDDNGSNAGVVPVASYISIATTAIVSSNTGNLVKTGFTFVGWNTANDGSGTAYASTGSGTFTIAANVKLFAQWRAEINFAANGGVLPDHRSGIMSNQAIDYKASANLTGNEYILTGYTFAGWNTQTNGSGTSYANNASYTMIGGNVTLYAQWTLNNYTITYYANGGSGTMPIQTIPYNTADYLFTNAFTRTGYSFVGWIPSSPTFELFHYVLPVYYAMTDANNQTMYAKWKANYTLGNYSNTSIATAGGNVSVTPDAIPTGGASVTVFTTTNFKGILTVNPNTGVVQITDAHPSGAYVVTVDAGFGITKTFTLTVGNTLCSQGQFYAPATPEIAVGSNPLSIAIGDFNGDGAQDIAVGNEIGNKVSISLGNGSGGFSGGTNVDVGQGGTFSIAVGDFNGDGKQDFAAANKGTSSVSIRLGNGLGGFSGAPDVAVGSNPYSVAIGDFNNDGKQDMATANAISNSVSIRLGNGLGGFSGTTNVTVGSGPQSVVIGDFNGDGNQDIAAANSSISSVSILMGDGSGGFTVATDVAVGSAPRSVAIGDFNADGYQDIATGNYAVNNFGLGSVSIRLGNGSGGFSGNAEVAVGLYSSSVAIGDFNGDGKQDIASANGNNVSIRLGDGQGGFGGNTNVAFAGFNYSLTIGDFNGDGVQDFVTANYNSGTVSIRFGGIAEINLKGNSVDIVSGDASPSIADDTDFGTVVLNTTKTKTYTIQNTGTGLLTINSIVISGTDAALFTKSPILILPRTIAAGSSTALAISARSTTLGAKTAIITINNDDCNEVAYSFAVQATIVAPPTLGNYDATNIVTAGGNTSVTPSEVPTGASSITAFTTTNFKGTLTVNPSNGVVQITDAHPEGTYVVTVGAGFGVTKTFTLIVGNTLCSQGQFYAPSTPEIGLGSNPVSVAIGDFNGDGKQDIALANYGSGTVTIRLGDGLGGFSGTTNVAVGLAPRSVAIGDFNGDGKQDIAVANYSSGTVSIRLGDGLGGFSGTTDVAVGTDPYSVAIGDFNKDGAQDFAVTNFGSGSVSVRFGNGSGDFIFPAEVSLGLYTYPASVAIGDFNNDGNQDIAVANNGSASVSIRLGNGFGGFSGTTNVAVGLNPKSVAIGDFNGDGKQDFVSTNDNSSGTLSIRFGDNLGGFSGTTDVAVGSNPQSVAVGDFNGDGKQDIATANSVSASVSILLGNGLGVFIGTTDVTVGSNSRSVAIGDFNGDGRQDFATANFGASSTVSTRLGGIATINLKGNSVAIVSGDITPATADDTDFGTVVLNTPTIKTYTIENTGTAALSISSIVSSGTDSADFVVGGITLPATIAAGTNNTFTLTFTPTSEGIKTATITINNDDCDESGYSFAVQGGNESLNTTDFSTIKLNFYPNPVKELLTISLDKTDIIKAYEIYDISGKRVDFNTNYNSNRINVSGFSSGVYLLKVQTDTGMLKAKFIKE